MDNYKTREREGVRIQQALCDREMTVELAGDLSLPDYQPEIKRLLRVRAAVVPPDKYIGSGNAEFTGTVNYTILYAGNDGALYCATHTDDYSFTCPVTVAPDVELGEGLISFCDILPETAVGRVVSPRKLSLKTRLRAHVRLLGTRLFEASVTGAAPESLQRLYGSHESAVRFCGVSDEIELGDEILYEGNDLRVIGAEGQVFVTEASSGSGSVNCRGEVSLKLLAVHEGEDALPTVQWRRIPFTQNVLVDGVEVNCDAIASGCCTVLSCTVEEGRILCNVGIRLTAEAQRNETVSYTRDIYSTSAVGEEHYITQMLSHAERCCCGNFSLNQTLTLEEAGIRSGMSVLDIAVQPVSAELSAERGKYIVTGKCRAQMILADGEEYFAQELELPMRYECEGGNAPVSDRSLHIEPISARARVDGERIAVDAELAVSLSTRSEEQVQMLSEANYSEPVSRGGAAYTVCYPSRDDSLWSVAKRYRRSVGELSESNSLPAAAAADTADSLAGVKFLLV